MVLSYARGKCLALELVILRDKETFQDSPVKTEYWYPLGILFKISDLQPSPSSGLYYI